MNGKVERITRYPEKGKPGEALDEAMLVAGFGIEGNAASRGERQVSLLLLRGWLDAQAEQGLCFARFKENLLISGIKTELLKTGNRLAAGGAVLRIGAEQKRCFAECGLYAGGKPCLLAAGAVFAAVETGGIIRVGDAVAPYCP